MLMLKDALSRLRRERGLTQEELARRLYITRQAVSRWETGATEPGVDMIKLIARELDVPVPALLDMPEHYCQSCGMMFAAPGQHGHEADGSETEDFCRWCYEGGHYTDDVTMDEMIEDCAPRMAEAMGWTVDEAASLLGAVLPTLSRWRQAWPPFYPASARSASAAVCDVRWSLRPMGLTSSPTTGDPS